MTPSFVLLVDSEGTGGSSGHSGNCTRKGGGETILQTIQKSS